VRTLRHECLDHLIPLDERHLRTILAEYVAYDSTERPHRILDLEPPLSRAQPRVARSAPGRCWAACITSTGAPLDPAGTFAPYTTRIE
jgi:hypothetical protein